MPVSSRDVLARLDHTVPDLVIKSLQAAPPGEPVPASPAASVVLLRDHGDGIETYALQRHSRMPFAPGMVVFPGGRVDPADGVPVVDQGLADPALLACSVRETMEETGVRLRPDDLRPWAHWITPESEPRRYDTFFYLAALPDGQHAADISGETSAARWQTPGRLLQAAAAGDIAMLPPTLSILIELTGFDSVSDALSSAADRIIETVIPKAVEGPDGWVFDYGGV